MPVCRLLLCLLLLVVATTTSAAVSVMDRHTGPLGQAVVYLEDPQQQLDYQQAYQRWLQGDFVPGTDATLTFGIGGASVWLLLELDNTTPLTQFRHLLLDTPWIDEVHFHVFRHGVEISRWITGDNYPFTGRSQLQTGFVKSLELRPGLTQVLIHASTPDPMLVPLRVMDDAELMDFSLRRVFTYGLGYGFLLALIFYNTALYFGIRDRRYLLYALYLSVFTIANFSYTGHGFAWLWPESVEWQRWAQPLLMISFGCAGLLFATTFLDMRRHWRPAYRAAVVSVVLVLLAFTLSLVLQNQPMALLVAFVFMLVFTLLMLLMGLYRVRQGSVSARFYLAAVVFGAVGTLVTTLSVWGALPSSEWTFRAAEMGMLVEATLLALALASRIRRAQQRQQQAELAANTDSLTQLNNRRALYQRAETFWGVAERRKVPLSVVVLDIDHFKDFNDTYGHAFGDAVLQRLGQCIRENIREQDLAARWGGEEFIILMPNTTLDKAVTFAGRLLEVLRNTLMEYEGERVQITASFGVAQIERQDLNLDDLIQRADQALYQAKHEGRNRVCSCGQM
ncbi:diguanylate cyclase [Marinospirillum alkaliphilum]|uniref:diguanylate cyclase n=1 Tax=Marinospirillum alkaliphilum DSM 21637 TaxID=1122209 RepID=A0A1K1TBP1_9GAMM|nr:diguanylate cyclase [Marinospirillum alkaliphilum]SFW98049.1 diguanylate cyclase (GGDEF) domain-containing protein [Marinospirillum alkaliphilum DSM 21637]